MDNNLTDKNSDNLNLKEFYKYKQYKNYVISLGLTFIIIASFVILVFLAAFLHIPIIYIDNNFLNISWMLIFSGLFAGTITGIVNGFILSKRFMYNQVRTTNVESILIVLYLPFIFMCGVLSFLPNIIFYIVKIIFNSILRI